MKNLQCILLPALRSLCGVRQYSATAASTPRHLTKISDFSASELAATLETAADLKANPAAYSDRMKLKSLIMLFQKPSLRTSISFQVGMTQMGGNSINYPLDEKAPLGVKETISDTAKVLSRYVDVIMARVNTRDQVLELSDNATVPVINGLDDYAHPTQMVADMQTIVEQKGGLDGIRMAFLGDVANNVTYDLMRAACVMGFHINVCGPSGDGFDVEQSVINECAMLSEAPGAGSAKVVANPDDAVSGVDVVYCDSWMSYGVSPAEEEARYKKFLPFQVNDRLMELTHQNSIFMNCLPAAREKEQTTSVIDGPKSVVFDQAENRLHAHKAIILKLVDGF